MTGSSAAVESDAPGLNQFQGFTRPVETFRPRMPWVGGDLQTVRNSILKPFKYTRTPLRAFRHYRVLFGLNDASGDSIAGLLSLPAGGNTDAATGLRTGVPIRAEAIRWSEIRPAMAQRPLVVLCHGLSGCETSHYMVATADMLLNAGYAVLRINLRGAGPSKAYSSSIYHAGRTGDVAAVIDALDAPADGLVLCGYSLGGNLILKLLGELGDDRRIAAAISISGPIDLKAAQSRIMAPRNRVYHYWFLRRMIADVMSVPDILDDDRRRALSRVRTVLDFDTQLVAPEAGYESADAYYADSSAIKYLPSIRRPTLLIHSADDPWIPVEPYHEFPWNSNDMLLPLILDRGGHVGFHDRGGPPSWHDRQILELLNKLNG